MVTDYAKPIAQRKRGGGKKAAALFWLSLLLPLLLSFLAAETFFGRRDSVVAYVPREAVVYVHAAGAQESRMLRAMSGLFPVDAPEAGLFAVPDGSGGQAWSAVLAWPWFSPPSRTEREILTANGATAVDSRTYLVGSATAVPPTALDGDAAVSRALRGLSRSFRIQGYARLSDVGTAPAWLAETPAAAFGVAKHSGRVRALVVEPQSVGPLFSPHRLPDARTDLDAPGPIGVPPSAFGSFVLADGLPNTFVSVFAEVERLRTSLGVPESDELREARTELAGLFGGNLTLLVDAGTVDAHGFAVHLPDADAAAAERAVARYLSASLPRLADVELPDGRTAREFIVEPHRIVFSGGRPTLHIRQSDDETLPELNLVIADRNGDTFMASGQRELDQLSDLLSDLLSDSRPTTSCLPDPTSSVTVNDAAALFADSPLASGFFKTKGIQQLTVYKHGDNAVFICE
ncbi:hypothetical protein ACFL26_00045 [Patescibacteria group bacterium]